MESSDKDDIGSLIAALTKGMSLTAEGSNKAASDMEARAGEQELKISQEEIETRRMSSEVFMDAKEAQNMDVEDVNSDEKPAESQEYLESWSSTIARTHFRLYDLPQEIRDGIFDLAYQPDPSGVKLVTKSSWDIEECRRSMEDENFQPRHFAHKINEILVSKRFFVDATQAFARTQTCTELRSGILSAFCTDFDIGLVDAVDLTSSTNAKSLRITLWPGDFGSTPMHLATSTVMDEAQIVESTSYQDLKSSSGLMSLHMKARVVLVTPDTKSAVWQANVEKLEQLLRPVVCQPKLFDEDTIEDIRKSFAQRAPMRLYPGSNVLFDRSQLTDTFATIPSQWACGSPIVEFVCGEAKKEERSLVGDEYWLADGNKSWPMIDEQELGCMLMFGEKPPKGLVQIFLDKNHDTVIEAFKDKAASSHAVENEVDDIPDTDEGLLDMMHTNPAAMLAWVRKAKAKEKQLVQLQAAVTSVSGILNGLELSFRSNSAGLASVHGGV